MKIVDFIINMMRLNPDDEEDYDYNNDEYELDEDEVVEAKEEKRTLRKEKKAEPVQEKSYVPDKPVKTTPKITPISKNSRKQALGMEVCVIKPVAIDEEIEIIDTLLDGRTVVLNMEGLNVEVAQRIIDFVSGATYAMRGNLQKISNYIFLATPSGVDISGDIQNMLDAFDTSGTGFSL